MSPHLSHPPRTAQVCILDGNKYNARCREVGEQRLEILEECEVLHNQKRDPLLHSSACKNDYHHPQARFWLPRTALHFCPSPLFCLKNNDIHVADSR